jgi:hypothetical protein
MWRAACCAATALLLAACGGESQSAVERSAFIVELELSLSIDLDEPPVFGQAGLTPTGADQTRIVIKLDDPFEPATAEIRRGGCSGFFRSSADYELGKVDDGELEAVVDLPLRELRQGHALVVRAPSDELPTRRDMEPQKIPFGTCGDLTRAEPTAE